MKLVLSSLYLFFFLSTKNQIVHETSATVPITIILFCKIILEVSNNPPGMMISRNNIKNIKNKKTKNTMKAAYFDFQYTYDSRIYIPYASRATESDAILHDKS